MYHGIDTPSKAPADPEAPPTSTYSPSYARAAAVRHTDTRHTNYNALTAHAVHVLMFYAHVHSATIRCQTLAAANFATVDGFLGEARAGELRSEALQMAADGMLTPGLLEGGRAAEIRSDYVGWVDDDARLQFPGFTSFLSTLDEFVKVLGRTGAKSVLICVAL